MRRRIPLHPAALLALLVASAAWAEPVAMIAAVRGRVTVAHGRRPLPARFGTPLEAGDRVVAAHGASATLLFNDGNALEIGAGSSITISGRVSSGSVSGNERLPREVFGSVVNVRLRGSRAQGLLVAPVMRGDADALTALSPQNTGLFAAPGEFRWSAVTGATRYVVTLSGSDGERWSRETPVPTLAWPEGEAPLADGDYLWEVTAYDAAGSRAHASATFQVAPAPQASAVAAVVERIHAAAGGSASPAARFLAGAYLQDHGFLLAAADEYRALAEIDPDSPAPHEALGEIYRTLGLTDLAAAADSKAKALDRAH